MRGLEALCAALVDLGVRHVFGLPGSQNADFFNALPEHGIRSVLATHELSASFMANGYARASGWPAVVATIPGPGFTYALPGLAEARLDSVPLLHLVKTPARGPQPFRHQALDQAAIAGPLVKEVVEVRSADRLRERLFEAHRLALDGEPGPVVVHLDPDALDGECRADARPLPPTDGPHPGVEPPWARELRELVAASERPVVFAGAGALDSAEDLARLAERVSAPTFTTLTARGVLPEDHRCSIPFDAERGGLEELNRLLERADLVLALGCKFSHAGTAGFGLSLPGDRLVQVNTDPAALGSTYPAALEIQATTKRVLSVLLDGSGPASRTRWTAAELGRARERIGRPGPSGAPEPAFHGVPGGTARSFFALVRNVLPRDAIVVTDAGLHQVMTRRYLDVLAPRGLMTPADFQSMGFGVPAAIGAALAAPSRPVVAIVGDGGLLMSAMDLACAVRERVPVVVVVFNDGFLNLIRLRQLRDDGYGTAVGLETPSLERLASAMAMRYGRLEGPIESMLQAALRAGQPTLLEVELRDSARIHVLKGVGMARRVARRTLGGGLVGRLKDLGGLSSGE